MSTTTFDTESICLKASEALEGLPIQPRPIYELFKTEEDFLKACQSSTDEYPALTWFYACRKIQLEDKMPFCDKVAFLHVTIDPMSREYNRTVIDKGAEGLLLEAGNVKYILFAKGEQAEELIKSYRALPHSPLVTEEAFDALLHPTEQDDRPQKDALRATVTPSTLEEAKARAPQQQGKKRWQSWNLLSRSDIWAFEEEVRRRALETSDLILPSHLIADGYDHRYLLTLHDKAKGREVGNSCTKGSYKYTERDGFRKVVWNSYRGVGGSYSIAQFMKDAPTQELTSAQIKKIEEQAERRRVAYERKRRIKEEQDRQHRKEWAMLYNASDGTIEGCTYLKDKQFPLAEIDAVLQGASVRYGQDGTLRIPYCHSSPAYADTFAGHQAINPATEPSKSFGRGADCGKDGEFIWSLLESDKATIMTTYLCEGLATGLSIWLATHCNVLVCFNAGGLVKVAKGIADHRLPLTWQTPGFAICADNDCEGKKNVGIESAERASQILRCKYFIPSYQGKKCDFDDLRLWQGIEAVREQLKEDRGLTPPPVSPNTRKGFTNSKRASVETLARRAIAYRPTDCEVTTEMLREAMENGDRGLGVLFSQIFHDRHLYDEYEGQWYTWQGHFWMPDYSRQVMVDLEYIRDLLREDARATYEADQIELDKDRETLRKLNEERARLNETCEKKGWERNQELARMDVKVRKQEERLESHQKACGRKMAEALRTADRINSMKVSHAILESASNGIGSLNYNGRSWDDCIGKLPVQNGIIDLATGELEQGKQEDYIRTACPIEYDRSAACPLFLSTLQDIFGDSDVINYFQRAMGYIVTGIAMEDKFFMWVGVGSNGKSMLSNIFKDILGDGISRTVKPELFLDLGKERNPNEADPSIIKLRGCRVAFCSETDQGKRFNTSKVKNTSGRDSLTGRMPYAKSDITFKVTHSTILLTNYRPHCDATDPALWRRIVAIPFRFSFVQNPTLPTEKPLKKDREQELRKEYPGILRWIVEGAMAYMREGLPQPPESIANYTSQYRTEEDMTAPFIEEVFCKAIGATVKTSRVYKLYQAWCRANGYKPMNSKALAKKLIESYNFNRVHKMDGDHYLNIRINEDAERELFPSPVNEQGGVPDTPF